MYMKGFGASVNTQIQKENWQELINEHGACL